MYFALNKMTANKKEDSQSKMQKKIRKSKKKQQRSQSIIWKALKHRNLSRKSTILKPVGIV
jgi:L-lactate utilization protein LutC